MPEFSVIIPVYNVEKHLGKCIDSILAQTFKDYELILIDDGSLDKSGEICEQYAMKDSRIVVVHQKNGGVSAARNKGIDKAKGRYITFIDSDDSVENNYLSSMYTISEDIDLVIGGIKHIEINGNEYDELYSKNQSLMELKRDILLEMIQNGSIKYAVSKRFNRNILLEKNIRFDCSMNLSEDTLFVANYLCTCKCVKYIGKTVYRYYRHNENTLSSFNTDYVRKLEDANEKIVACLEKQYSSIRMTKIWKQRCFSVYYYGIFQILQNSNYTLKEKYWSLKSICIMEKFVEYMSEKDSYMCYDSKLIRKIIGTRNPHIILIVWEIISFKNKWRVKS